ncbi:hypothetical protein [Effusibacillus lacus]|uniref:Uncharacterized protein n=1 Tax=Effusibacillus lacus TaxID=1348429 RepID=A0A292YQ90_9BACL|nr:hypothetical protein [Effusibacillus lacus]TCS70092.1 hypothetical protein EDD64_13457 [Effusibacillus lacus]GAX91071.1 hypothetical protein EFBL_2731 [Effusibacillus lacus]
MRWHHWLLAVTAIGILAAQQLIAVLVDQAGRYILYHYTLEIAYFFVLMALGISIGSLVQKRMLVRQDREEFLKNRKMYYLLAFLFAIAGGMYLIAAWIPGWIGKHIIFFGGYYYGLAARKVPLE